MEKEDRRIRKSKSAIYDALITLLENKEPEKITVRELVELADINRATFYNHYQDIFALYDELSDSIVREVYTILEKMENADYTRIVTALVNRILENKRLFRLVLNNRIGTEVLISALENKYLEICTEKGTKELNDRMVFDSVMTVNGGVAVLKRWANGGYEYPADKIIRFLSSIGESDSGI